MSFARSFLSESIAILQQIDADGVDRLAVGLGRVRAAGAKVFGIVGKDGGYTKQAADECVVIPVVSPDRITPHTEGMCAVVWHLLVSHPALQVTATKWESMR